jgi:hypothetical protein
MTTPELPTSHDFTPRRGTTELTAPFEEAFVGETLFNAAEFLAEVQGLELEDLLKLERPLSITIARPTQEGHREYEFFVCVDEAVEATDAPAFEYVLSCADTETTPLSDVTVAERQNIRNALAETEEADEDLLFLLGLEEITKEHEKTTLTRQYRTYYRCAQQALAIEKNVETNYSIDGDVIASVTYASPEEISDPSDPDNPILMDRLMDLSVIELDDVLTMKEILYYLSLPGGEIATEVTTDYLDDARVVRN